MSQKDGKDYLYLIWKDPNKRKSYIVGVLSKNGQFEFAYGEEIDDALRNGFEPLIPFNDINKVYYSDILFPIFSSRLPDRKRKGIEKILRKYKLDEFDEYQLLKRSGAKLPIDNLWFVDPILFEDEDKLIERSFFIAGSRHYMGCEQGNCCLNKVLHLRIDELLMLELDINNLFDENAIVIKDKEKNKLGYVPRYYSEPLARLLREKRKYQCRVIELNDKGLCDECVKVELRVYENTNVNISVNSF